MPVFNQALAAQQPQPQQTSQQRWDAILQAQLERLNATDQRPPMYSPEEAAQRREQNQREYELGIYSMLSGSEPLANFGGAIFKNALAMRQPKITEHGSVDQISGEYKYSPEYLRRLEQDKYDRIQLAAAAAADREDTQNRQIQAQKDIARERRDTQIFLKTLAGGAASSALGAPAGYVDKENTQQVFRSKDGKSLLTIDPQGNIVPHAGPVYAKSSGGQPSEDERKAGGWVMQVHNAMDAIEAAHKMDPNASKPTATEMVLQSSGKHGKDLAYARMTPARQLFTTGVSELTEAVLRAASGANVPEAEIRQKVEALTPRYNEAPEVTKWKRDQMDQYVQSLEVRAGRAMPAVRAAEAARAAAKGNPAATPPAPPAAVDFNDLNPQGSW